ncbi:MAG: hypothetical protein HC906_06020 [Bacteroidales bacterium]|nr:hypothetical protein [Bacteroidales bacterium]
MLRHGLPSLYLSQGLVYLYLIYFKLKNHFSANGFWLFKKKSKLQSKLFSYWVHALLLTLLILFVKLTFERDLGDYIIATYFSMMLYVSVFMVVTSRYSAQQAEHEKTENSSKPKYEKSPLSEEKKDEIQTKVQEILKTGNTILKHGFAQ